MDLEFEKGFKISLSKTEFVKYLLTSETRLGCGTKSMLTYPAAEIIKLFEIICNNALILRQMADQI